MSQHSLITIDTRLISRDMSLIVVSQRALRVSLIHQRVYFHSQQQTLRACLDYYQHAVLSPLLPPLCSVRVFLSLSKARSHLHLELRAPHKCRYLHLILVRPDMVLQLRSGALTGIFEHDASVRSHALRHKRQ